MTAKDLRPYTNKAEQDKAWEVATNDHNPTWANTPQVPVVSDPYEALSSHFTNMLQPRIMVDLLSTPNPSLPLHKSTCNQTQSWWPRLLHTSVYQVWYLNTVSMHAQANHVETRICHVDSDSAEDDLHLTPVVKSFKKKSAQAGKRIPSQSPSLQPSIAPSKSDTNKVRSETLDDASDLDNEVGWQPTSL